MQELQHPFVSWEEAVAWLKSQPDMADLVMACYYDAPITKAAARYFDSLEWTGISRLLADFEKGAVLDVGAGRGISSYALAREGWLVTALEPDASKTVGAGAIREMTAETGLDIKVIEKHGEELPFADASFDLVFIRQVLHHIADLELFCSEVFRVLKPGGHFLAVREHVISKREDLPRFLADHPLHDLYGGENAHLLTDYLSAFRLTGFAMEKVLAPYDSDINLFPKNIEGVRKRIEEKLRCGLPDFFFRRIVVPLLNFRDDTPGRLYSFLGVRP